MSPSQEPLSSAQLHALLDLLTHHQVCEEVKGLKHSDRIQNFGHPVQPRKEDHESAFPLINLLIHKFVLNIPGLRNVDEVFWTKYVPDLLTAIDDSNLSESYDKGSVGTRKTVATAICSIVEGVSRGVLGGFNSPHRDRILSENLAKAEAAWYELLEQLIYGDLVTELFEKVAQTAQLSEHTEMVQAAHEYILIMYVQVSAVSVRQRYYADKVQVSIILAFHTHTFAPGARSLVSYTKSE